MNRRQFLGTAISVGVAGCSSSTEVLAEDSNPMEKEFGMFSPGFDSLLWNESGDVEIRFDPDHGMDAFTINHEYRSDYDEAIYADKAPEFDGTVGVPLLRKFEQDSRAFPTRKFELHAYTGMFTSVFANIDDHKGKASFEVPEQIAPSHLFGDVQD